MDVIIPFAVIGMNLCSNLYTDTNINWNYLESSDTEGKTIINAEWQFDSENVTTTPNGVISTVGDHIMKLRVKDTGGFWSDWVSYCFNVIEKKVMEFNCTNDVQTYTVGLSGNYKLEVWGAEGGYSYYSGKIKGLSGNGGYFVGEKCIDAGTILYIYVGATPNKEVGGYNGGGKGGGG